MHPGELEPAPSGQPYEFRSVGRSSVQPRTDEERLAA
jgi:hypothetical protein